MFFNCLIDWTDKSNGFVNWFYDSEFVFGIQKYAICILTGIILAYFICTIEGERMGINKDKVLSCATVIVPLSILGARIFYMLGDQIDSFGGFLTYENGNFFKALIDLFGFTIGFNPKAGWTYDKISGLAIYGGVVVAIVGTFFASRICKWKFSSTCDMVAPGLLIGQICGRWGNFFNKEAYGIVVGGWNKIETASGYNLIPWWSTDAQYDFLTKNLLIPKFIAVNMKMSGGAEYDFGMVDGVKTYGYVSQSAYYYPTFYFESLYNFIGLMLYFVLRRNKKIRSGSFMPLYLIWYGIGRFFIEFIRTDSLYIGNTDIKMNQLIPIVMIIAGIIILILNRFAFKAPSYYSLLNFEKKNKKEAK